jgi:hypothetical protein
VHEGGGSYNEKELHSLDDQLLSAVCICTAIDSDQRSSRKIKICTAEAIHTDKRCRFLSQWLIINRYQSASFFPGSATRPSREGGTALDLLGQRQLLFVFLGVYFYFQLAKTRDGRAPEKT